MPRRPADVFAGEGSFAGKLKARRKADPASPDYNKDFRKPAKKKKKADKKKRHTVKKSEKSKTLRDVLLSKPAKDKRDPMRRGQ